MSGPHLDQVPREPPFAFCARGGHPFETNRTTPETARLTGRYNNRLIRGTREVVFYLHPDPPLLSDSIAGGGPLSRARKLKRFPGAIRHCDVKYEIFKRSRGVVGDLAGQQPFVQSAVLSVARPHKLYIGQQDFVGADSCYDDSLLFDFLSGIRAGLLIALVHEIRNADSTSAEDQECKQSEPG
jgi:hypothetical protein